MRDAPVQVLLAAASRNYRDKASNCANLLPAKNCRQRRSLITTGLHPTTDIDLPMSVFALFASGIGGEAVVGSDG